MILLNKVLPEDMTATHLVKKLHGYNNQIANSIMGEAVYKYYQAFLIIKVS
jgi:hypothetical protein